MMSRERPKWEQPFVKHRPHTLWGSCRRDSTVMSLWPRRTPPPLDQPRVELRLRAASTSSSSRSCRRGRVKLVEVLLLSLMSLRPHRTPPPLAHVAEAASNSSSSSFMYLRPCRSPPPLAHVDETASNSSSSSIMSLMPCRTPPPRS